jgi:hypothetical protein
MIHYRRVCGVVVLFVVSAALTAFDNNFWGTIYDYAANKYWAGLATVAVSIPIHTCVIRRILPRQRLWSQLLGVAVSGILSIVIHELFCTIFAHRTWLQRQGSGVNWGDDGSLSGLPAGAMFGIHWPTFFGHLPITLTSACIYGVLWFPLLVWLERSIYPRSETSAALEA